MLLLIASRYRCLRCLRTLVVGASDGTGDRLADPAAGILGAPSEGLRHPLRKPETRHDERGLLSWSSPAVGRRPRSQAAPAKGCRSVSAARSRPQRCRSDAGVGGRPGLRRPAAAGRVGPFWKTLRTTGPGCSNRGLKALGASLGGTNCARLNRHLKIEVSPRASEST